MTPDLTTLWVATWHEKGALHAQKLADYLREVNDAWLAGRRPEKWPTAVTRTLEGALEHNRNLKRSFGERMKAEG